MDDNNTERNIDSLTHDETDYNTESNRDKEIESNEANIMVEEIGSTAIKCNCEDAEKIDTIENLLRGREKAKRKSESEGDIIQKLVKEKIIYKKKLEEANNEVSCNAKSHMRNITALVRWIEMGEDVKKAEISELAEKITEMKTKIEELEEENRALRKKIKPEVNEGENNKGKITVVLGRRGRQRFIWEDRECRIHGNHKAKECRIMCSFCRWRGSHVEKECRKKTNKKTSIIKGQKKTTRGSSI